MNFNFQPPSTFGFQKNFLHKSSSPFEDLSAYKTLMNKIECRKFCICLRSLNVYHFATTTELNIMAYNYYQLPIIS
jgi:hypothetical protein